MHWLVLASAFFVLWYLLSRLFERVVMWDIRRLRRRQAQAVQQAQMWAAAVLASDAEAWPPRPEPHQQVCDSGLQQGTFSRA